MESQVFYAALFVCLCVSAVVIWYIARRNPNPRFRPRPGEIVLLSIIAFGLSGGVAYMMGGIFGNDPALQEQITKDLDQRNRGGSSAPVSETPGLPEKEDVKDDETLPPWEREGMGKKK